MNDPLELTLALVPFPSIVVDGGGMIVHANDLVAELLGWEREELAGRKLETLIPGRFRAAHAQHFDR